MVADVPNFSHFVVCKNNSTFAFVSLGYVFSEEEYSLMNFKILHEIYHSPTVRNSTKLLSANVVAQVVGLILYPVLTRIYSPEDFGLLNLFLGIGGILALISTAEYQYAIVLPKEEYKAKGVMQVGLFVLFFVTAIVLLSVPFSKPIANLFNAPELASWYGLMPLYVLFSGGWVLLNFYYTRQKAFGRISAYQVSQSVLNAGAKLGFGLGHCLRGGLILSTVFSAMVAVCVSVVRSWRNGLKDLFRVDKSVCWAVAREYANFPKYSLPKALVNNVSSSLPAFLLTPFFGLTELGFWAMALTLAFRPINMVATSFYQVLFQNVADKVNKDESIRPLILRFLKRTWVVIVPCFVCLYFVLPWLTEWLLGGTQWRATGEYIRLMLPWLACNVVGAALGFVVDVFRKQRMSLYIEVASVCLRLLGLLVGVWLQSFYYAVLGYCVASALVNLSQIVWYVCLVGNYERNRVK